MIYYAASTNGFYDSDINPVIPDDAVTITAERHQELIDGQSITQVIAADQNGYPVLRAPVPVPPTAQQNKDNAINRLIVTDWVNQPDVYDTTRTPHLTNRDAFLTYRTQVRLYIITPVDGFIDWPTEPRAAWSV